MWRRDSLRDKFWLARWLARATAANGSVRVSLIVTTPPGFGSSIGRVTEVDTLQLGDNTGLDPIVYRPRCLDDPRLAGLEGEGVFAYEAHGHRWLAPTHVDDLADTYAAHNVEQPDPDGLGNIGMPGRMGPRNGVRAALALEPNRRHDSHFE